MLALVSALTESQRVLLYALSLCALVALALWLKASTRSTRLPPGPGPLPLLGNIHQIYIEHQERKFAQWSQVYGDTVYARFFWTPALILNSIHAAHNLMDKRSAKYSGRPHLVMLGEMLGWDRTLGVLDYGEIWRKQRKWTQGALNDKATSDAWQSVQRRETCNLLMSLIAAPNAFTAHLKRYTGALIMEIAYGYTVTSNDDECLRMIGAASDGTVECAGAGGALVDFLPILKYVPSWFPGGRFKRRVWEVNYLVQEAQNRLYDTVRERMKAGTAKPSILSSLLDGSLIAGTLAEDEVDIKGIGGALYSGLSRYTTYAVLTTFILAMTLHPKVLKRAQAEVDEKVGHSRLPDYSDRENLPYIECVLKEVYRWICPLPLGLPHCATEDDEYLGYHIPKGTMVVPNIWSMSRDADIYPEPDRFVPERFIHANHGTNDIADPRGYIFGFGRRICPGRQFADMSVWLAIANIVATMEICKARDAAGNETSPEVSYMPGLVSHPRPFKCSIRPRSQRTEAVIMQAKSALDI
ncbi:cytochrome P450 [Wolfiporia cocos MD-104 SS10]|uniref:Cytochrome P450 n=1 Tax=Wolfiporia cocos (strain MD-104) TaxID=742152 RepID=A0A2H3JZD6_WOLCO|nr:cytochrome P450 [Wolfiporia cocos MD-104 SS10]